MVWILLKYMEASFCQGKQTKVINIDKRIDINHKLSSFMYQSEETDFSGSSSLDGFPEKLLI